MRMQLHFLVPSADKVVDDVRGRGVAASTAEPFVTAQTLDDTGRIVDATVSVVPDTLVSCQYHRAMLNLRAGMWW